MSAPRILKCSCGKRFANQSSLNMHMSATKHPAVSGVEQKQPAQKKQSWLKRILKKIFRKS